MTGKNRWHVYIVRCRDGTFYTGIARRLEKRIEEHNSGQAGARYTRSRRPVALVHAEEAASRSAALKRESSIKKLSRAGKKQLIDGTFS